MARLDARPALDLLREVEADAAESSLAVDLLLGQRVEEVLLRVTGRASSATTMMEKAEPCRSL